MVGQYVIIYCLQPLGWFELYHHYIKYAYQRNVYDETPAYYLGFPVYGYFRCTDFPGVIIRLLFFYYLIVILGTSFYLSDIVINGKILPNQGGSPILFQHLFWFLGHPEVYIIALPAMGITSEVISTNSRKPIFGYMAMVGSFFAIAILSFLVWAHHMFVSGLNPFLGSFFVLFTLLIAVPSAIKVFNWLTTLWKGNIHFTPAMLFAIGFVSLFISGGLTGIWLGNSNFGFTFARYLFCNCTLPPCDGCGLHVWNVCRYLSLVSENVWKVYE